jgi:hypothetical protein
MRRSGAAPPPWLDRSIGDRVPCAIHRGIETALRCTRCGTPICPKCLEHTDSGAQCPRCARRRSRAALDTPGAVRAVLGAFAGVAIGGIGGAVLMLMPFGALLVLPFLLLGVLTGEVIAAVAGRPGGAFIALIGLLVGLMGPLAGRAVAAAVISGSSTTMGLSASAESLGPLGLLLVIGSALLAGVRAGSSHS